MTRSKLLALAVLSGVLLSGNAAAEDKQAPASPYNLPAMTPAISAMMNPMVYSNLMGYTMNPMPLMTDPVSACKQCHTDEDIARYQKTMGPMLTMMSPVNLMTPTAYPGMMVPLMDAKAYTEWYNAWMKKYGAAEGATTDKK